VSMR